MMKKILKKLVAVAMGSALSFTAMEASPAKAALLDFGFTTDNNGIGSFTLDTGTSLSSVDGSFVVQAFTYLNAISNFSFSSPSVNFSSPSADFITRKYSFGPIPISSFPAPLNSSILSPSGCSVFVPLQGPLPDGVCETGLDFTYTGDSLQLSSDPNSYSLAGGSLQFGFQPDSKQTFTITSFTSTPESDPSTNAVLTPSSFVSALYKPKSSITAVPEPDSGLSTLVFGTLVLGFLLKRKVLV